jgi:septum formation protein
LTQKEQLYLASASPRRGELLRQIGVAYVRCPVDVDEQPRDGESPEAFVQRMAREKAEAARASGTVADGTPVLGADTIVVVDNVILGKPRDRDDALSMLARLSGRSHRVMSAVAIVTAGQSRISLSVSTVTFRSINKTEMEAYWASGEPGDKAGGYAIQGRGAAFVAHLSGSFSGVMGLPLFETCELLRHFGVNIIADA